MVMSVEVRQAKSSGSISNVMSQDCEAVQLAVQSLHSLWSAPLRITVALILLYKQLGIAAFAGSLVLAISLPLQKKLVSLQEKLTKESLKRSDERVQVI